MRNNHVSYCPPTSKQRTTAGRLINRDINRYLSNITKEVSNILVYKACFFRKNDFLSINSVGSVWLFAAFCAYFEKQRIRSDLSAGIPDQLRQNIAGGKSELISDDTLWAPRTS